MIRQLRLLLMILLIKLSLKICPKDCTNTLIWLGAIPFED